jgi:hypothetical protein
MAGRRICPAQSRFPDTLGHDVTNWVRVEVPPILGVSQHVVFAEAASGLVAVPNAGGGGFDLRHSALRRGGDIDVVLIKRRSGSSRSIVEGAARPDHALTCCP